MILKTYKNFILIGTILFINLLLDTRQAYAQESSGLGFIISPSITELDMDPGDSLSVSIDISKQYAEPIPISIYVSPYYPEENSKREFTDSLPDSVDWLILSENSMILEGAEEKPVKVTIKVPNDATPGSYFSAVIFEPILPESYFLEQSAHIYPHIGALLVINVNGEKLSDKVRLRSFDYTAETEEPSYFTSNLVNDDKYYSTVKGEILVQDIFGNIKDTLQVEETRILPGESRTLINQLNTELPLGFYKANFMLIKHNELNTESISFVSIKAPTATFIFILIITISFAIILYKYTSDILKKTKYPTKLT